MIDFQDPRDISDPPIFQEGDRVTVRVLGQTCVGTIQKSYNMIPASKAPMPSMSEPLYDVIYSRDGELDRAPFRGSEVRYCPR